ncbi:MAG: H-type small acid-soluble spore protein [Halanaerobiales bacterium]
MNTTRAQQIINSSEEINVTYQGKSVWLTDINSGNNTATVKMPVHSDNIVEVPLAQLIEQG